METLSSVTQRSLSLVITLFYLNYNPKSPKLNATLEKEAFMNVRKVFMLLYSSLDTCGEDLKMWVQELLNKHKRADMAWNWFNYENILIEVCMAETKRCVNSLNLYYSVLSHRLIPFLFSLSTLLLYVYEHPHSQMEVHTSMCTITHHWIPYVRDE